MSANCLSKIFLMLPKTAILRIARPTDNLADVVRMYVDGLGFAVLGEFYNHNKFDGVILGHPQHAYHLEFTHHACTTVGRVPTEDNLLVFYINDYQLWFACCEKMLRAGFNAVVSYNPYWDTDGCTFEDVDGYRVVLQHGDWTA
jgi:hypothetical protein